MTLHILAQALLLTTFSSLALPPDDPWAAAVLAAVNPDSPHEEVLSHYRRALKTGEHRAEILVSLGDYWAEAADPKLWNEAAVDDATDQTEPLSYTEETDVDAEQVEQLNLQGLAVLIEKRENRQQKALACYLAATNIAPDFSVAWARVAMHKAAKPSWRLRASKTLQRLDPDNAWPAYLTAAVYIEQDAWPQALKAVQHGNRLPLRWYDSPQPSSLDADQAKWGSNELTKWITLRHLGEALVEKGQALLQGGKIAASRTCLEAAADLGLNLAGRSPCTVDVLIGIGVTRQTKEPLLALYDQHHQPSRARHFTNLLEGLDPLLHAISNDLKQAQSQDEEDRWRTRQEEADDLQALRTKLGLAKVALLQNLKGELN